ncbi:Integrase/recombinase xerD-like [Stylophora pistillata]|uniref:Integrase/recombinase xerD-like n=1 Tax=Stylophora pistillata TaxID=50429 RepID=A0A2B4SV01_STYPI|nr:Integrase/recombinase xerD-like [Stylophora pistillata]
MEILLFAICPFWCIGLFCARGVLGPSVPRNMGPSVPSNVFQSEMWSEFFSSTPEHLQPTASLVKGTVLGSKADGTDANFPSPVFNAVYSIDWAQQMAGLSKISIYPLVSLMVTASQKFLGKPKVKKKDPVTPEILKALVESKRITDKSPSLSDLRSVALCLIGYAGFFRFSELSQIKACDVKFFASYASIFLESSKTDQFRDGAWIVIARSDLPTCPVKALEEYVSAAQIDLSEELPLFRPLTSPRSKAMVRSQGISYSRARELVKDAFRGLTDVSKLSVHSLRAGGATSAANAGIPDRLFKRHGRWASENAKDG